MDATWKNRDGAQTNLGNTGVHDFQCMLPFLHITYSLIVIPQSSL